MNYFLFVILAIAFLATRSVGQERELTASEKRLIEIFGPQTPKPMQLWSKGVPQGIENPPREEVTSEGRIQVVSTPTISVYLPPKAKATGMAIIMFPGGGYGALDWVTHVVGSADSLNPEGIAIIGLKYRTCKPYPIDKGIQKIALLDAQRAVRLVRHHSADWGIEPKMIGVAGYSAGGNLAMLLAGDFDLGDPKSADPIDRMSCRPDFVVGCSVWHWRETKSPYTFRKDTPPVFLIHATNDGIAGATGKFGGAPIQLPREIKTQLESLGVPVKMVEFAEGGHGVGNLIPSRYRNGFPGAQWPKLLREWLKTLQENK